MRIPGRYILIGQTAVPEPDLEKWFEWYEGVGADRVVFQTDLPSGMVSTVFLGLDHQWGDGPPLLFETMVFHDGEGDDWFRCSTWLEAEQLHKRVVDQCMKAKKTR